MNYLALDVETANADYSSICQIGIVEFDKGEVINRWNSYINPEVSFDSFNVMLHGIDEKKVANAPLLPHVFEEIISFIDGRITVHHMPFDRIALSRAFEKYGLPKTSISWLDSAKVARRTWEEVAHKGYGLKNLANILGIKFNHHDALEDAIVSGIIVREASTLKGLTVEEWVKQIERPITSNVNFNFNGNPNGPLFGQNLVFTGSLSLPRKEAGEIAARLGCNVKTSVTKTTTILVVGIQDSYKLSGYEKSSKHRKAEKLIQEGFDIQILSETDFKKIIDME